MGTHAPKGMAKSLDDDRGGGAATVSSDIAARGGELGCDARMAALRSFSSDDRT